jgi:hypothetical protein
VSRGARRVLPALLTVALLAVVALGAWGAVEAARAVGAARDGRAAATQLQTELGAGSWAAASTEVDRLGADVDRLAAATSSLPLRLAAHAPVVGADVRAAREVALGLQQASRDAQPLARATRGLRPSDLVVDGRIDLARVQTLLPAAAEADQGLAAAHQRIGAIDASALHQPLRGNVADLQQRLADLQQGGATQALARHLPRLLSSSAG